MSYTRCGSCVEVLYEPQEKGGEYTDAAQGFSKGVSIEGSFDADVRDI